MKRSEINRIIDESAAFFEQNRFALPPFCRISPDEWERRIGELSEVICAGLGWDVTDFGLGEFEKTGIVLVTLRNGGTPNAAAAGKTYCEKIIHMRVGQVCPMHHHRQKTEDIINRGGGVLCFDLHPAQDAGEAPPDDDRFVVFGDGMGRRYEPGRAVRLPAGESLTLVPYLSHSFWAEGKDVMVGEVSTVNDDESDNVFYREMPRFPESEEDEAPRYLLVHETRRLLHR